MTLRRKFRALFSNSSFYPGLRTIYRNISAILFPALRKSAETIFSVFGLDILFPRYAAITLPLQRPLIVFRGFDGVTLIGRKHYFSRNRIVLNYFKNKEVQGFISHIRDNSGFPICPISILETALAKEGVYRSKPIRRYQKVSPSHSIGNGQGTDIYLPRESSFFHFFVQVVPFILRTNSTNKLWIDLDPATSNLDILQEMGLVAEELLNQKTSRRISRFAMQNGHYPSSTETQLLRNRLSELGYSRNPKKNLYITRKGNINGRHIRNEFELIALLSRFNFEVVDPGTLSFKEQLSLFSQAKVVVAPHGAALSHILNFPLEAKVLELNGDSDIRWHIRKMAKNLDIDHYLLLGKSYSDGSFMINLELVENFLQKVSSEL
jgi:hypothetical protein